MNAKEWTRTRSSCLMFSKPILPPYSSCSFSNSSAVQHLLWLDVPSDVSTTPLDPIQSLSGMVLRARHRPYKSALKTSMHMRLLTFFLNCLCIASSASFIVTPFRFRAETSRPNGKCRSIFLTGGVVSNFLRTVGSSTSCTEVLTFLDSASA